MNLRHAATLLALTAAACFNGEAWADTTECTEITTMGTHLEEQGVYCLKRSFFFESFAQTAITVAANNVTIDCNGNSMHQQHALPHTAAAIKATGQDNLTVRNCTFDGFRVAVEATGDGIVIEDNVVRSSWNFGIKVAGNHGLVQRNQVIDTGGVASTISAEAINVKGTMDVLDNLVAGVSAMPGSNQTVWGIRVGDADGGQIARNRIYGLTPAGTGQAAGVVVSHSIRMVLLDNTLVHSGASEGYAMVCTGGTGHATANHLVGWDVAGTGCVMTANVVKP